MKGMFEVRNNKDGAVVVFRPKDLEELNDGVPQAAWILHHENDATRLQAFLNASMAASHGNYTQLLSMGANVGLAV